jgi:hypothetical protein
VLHKISRFTFQLSNVSPHRLLAFAFAAPPALSSSCAPLPQRSVVRCRREGNELNLDDEFDLDDDEEDGPGGGGRVFTHQVPFRPFKRRALEWLSRTEQGGVGREVTSSGAFCILVSRVTSNVAPMTRHPLIRVPP